MNPSDPGHRIDDVVRQMRPRGHEQAVAVVMSWLGERHAKGWRRAFEEWLTAAGEPDVGDLDEDVLQMLMVNAGEWLLARGEIQARREQRNINQYLLGRDGPYLTPPQREWIAQLASRRLGLWRVTEVIPGVGLTLVDETDADAPPLHIAERSASRTLTPGLLLGARTMDLGEYFELSGAVYPFSKLHEPTLLDAYLAQQDPLEREWVIVRQWLAQHTEPPPLPQLIHSSSGEPILLITDHYQVCDAAALAAALAACADVSGDAVTGWRREVEGADGFVRSLVAMNPGASEDRLELFYQTQKLADDGRPWFEAQAGDAVRFLAREITDPRHVLRQGGAVARDQDAAADPPSSVPAEVFEQLIRRTYARWADEPIPALGSRTPRQAIATPGGLERVKGLLREYEAGEKDMARRDRRAPVSYQFLWDALGIER